MKKIMLCLFLIVSMVSVKAQVEIANFDDGVNVFDCSDDGGGVASFEVVDNLETTGCNTTSKAFKIVLSDGGEWWSGLRMLLPVTLEVNDQNRYLHIMMRFKNIGTQNFHFALNSSSVEKWSELTMARDQWFDYVIDLYNVEGVQFADLVSLRYQSRPDNPVNMGNEVYIDEVIINNNPMPRGVTIETAGTIADFEDGSFNNLRCSDDGGGVSLFEVTENQDNIGLNTSNMALRLEVATTPADYWQGLRVMFPNVIVINEDTRYFHIMMHHTSNDQSYEFIIFADGEHYQSEKMTEASWIDHVIDLNGLMGKSITGFRYATRIDRPNNLGSIRYLDEIAFNADPMPRTPISSSLQDEDVSKVNVFNSATGVTIQGFEGQFTIYDMKGVLVYRGISVGNTHVDISQGFYTVEIGSKRHKIRVR